MSGRNQGPGYGLAFRPLRTTNSVDEVQRPQGDGASEARLPRNVRPRYELGVFPCPGSHVLSQIPPEASGIPGCSTKFPTRHRGFNVGNESFEEGA